MRQGVGLLIAYQQPAILLNLHRHAAVDKTALQKAKLRGDPAIAARTGDPGSVTLIGGDLDLGENGKFLQLRQLALQHRRAGQQQQAVVEAEQAEIAPQLALGITVAARGLLPWLQGVDITGDLTLQIFDAILAADTGDGQLGQGKRVGSAGKTGGCRLTMVFQRESM